MNNVEVTLKEFFGLKDIKLDETGLEAVKQQAGNAVAGFGWNAFAEGLKNSIASNFDMSIGGILAAAWSKRRELMKYLEKPEATNYLRLAKHTVSSDHKPEVEVLLNEKGVAKFQFEVKFKLDIEGANLMIHEGMLKKVTAVSGKGSCTISYKGYELYKKESQQIDLPGEVEFNPGIVIRSAAEPARVTQTFATV
ncbi:MAG: hypothetical protein KA368_02850 [Acidobacteria bacterium]|nr:hypothetical protein [Acidobacteriota bacterium]